MNDGDIVFKSPTKEFLRFKGDGSILVEGRPAAKDEQVVDAFKTWLKTSSVSYKGQPSQPVIMGEQPSDTTFQSGKGVSPYAKGGNVVFHGKDE
jgi:hypothetical protein